MNARCIPLLLVFAGCAAEVAPAAEPAGSLSRELLESSYSYQLPTFAYSIRTTSPTLDFRAQKPVEYDFRKIEEALAKERDRRTRALYVRTLFHKQELDLLAKPDVESINTTWMPTTVLDVAPVTFSTAFQKLEVRVPLARVSW